MSKYFSARKVYCYSCCLFQVSSKKEAVFRNIVTIMLFGAIGTAISRTVITLGTYLDIGIFDLGDYLAIGAIFAATDSVCTLQVLNQDETPLLYSLVFGGVVNDATSVVVFNVIQSFDFTNLNHGLAFQLVGNFSYLFLLSTLLGVAVDIYSYFLYICFPIWSKSTCPHMACLSHSTDREVALMMLMTYLSYMLAELFDLSGILTVFFCGIVMSHYTWHNVTESTRITTKHTFWNIVISCGDIYFLVRGNGCLLMLGRAAFVFPLSFLSNLAKKNQSEKINFKMQVVIWWSGLIRGAVLMALAYNKFTMAGHTDLHEHAIMITSTITVCLFSTMVFGMLTKPLIRYLFPHQQGPTSMLSDDNNNIPKSIQVPLLDQDSSIEEVAGNENLPRPDSIRGFLTWPTKTVHYYWRQFDDSFMRPVFGGRGFGPFVSSSPTERGPPGLSGA
ncbi:hypothetical protein HID58_077137 [Brassica napus]|uniref:Cation/H+ exchanger transmembrane domain-containing protein n=1 Tax=Brassica napus TaxID=3708 RepID=A0ABQ7YPG4_BRANA|nr:hypothetical protein HID58_077137 [Brassica napus]